MRELPWFENDILEFAEVSPNIVCTNESVVILFKCTICLIWHPRQQQEHTNSFTFVIDLRRTWGYYSKIDSVYGQKWLLKTSVCSLRHQELTSSLRLDFDLMTVKVTVNGHNIALELLLMWTQPVIHWFCWPEQTNHRGSHCKVYTCMWKGPIQASHKKL